MQPIPTRIAGVRIARQPGHDRSDRVISSRFNSSAPGLLPRLRFHEIVGAECGFASDPQYSLRFPVRRSLRCAEGEVYVAVLDVRLGSPTFGEWQGFYLDKTEDRVLLVPRGVAVGWQVCSNTAQVEIGYSHQPDRCDWRSVRWDDPNTAAKWPMTPTSRAKPLRVSRWLDEISDERLPEYRRKRPHVKTIENVTPHATRLSSTSANRPVALVKSNASATPKSTAFADSKSRATGPILIIGSSGKLGHDLARHFRGLGTVVGACRTPEVGSLLPIPVQVDVSRPASLREAIRVVKPSLIVNAAGLTDVDSAESEPRLAQLVNATAPAIMAEEAKKIGAGLLHFCSDMVFDGTGERPYRETDVPNPMNQFARTKLIGCQAIESIGVEHLIVRTGWLYSSRGECYIRRIMDLLTYRNSLTLPSDHCGSPTSTDWLGSTLAQILGKANGSFADWMRERGGLFHVSMLGYASRLEVGDQIVATCKAYGVPVVLSRLRGLPLSELPGIAKIPANCKLDPTLFATHFDVALPRWQEELNVQIAQMLGEAIPIRQVA